MVKWNGQDTYLGGINYDNNANINMRLSIGHVQIYNFHYISVMCVN